MLLTGCEVLELQQAYSLKLAVLARFKLVPNYVVESNQ